MTTPQLTPHQLRQLAACDTKKLEIWEQMIKNGKLFLMYKNKPAGKAEIPPEAYAQIILDIEDGMTDYQKQHYGRLIYEAITIPNVEMTHFKLVRLSTNLKPHQKLPLLVKVLVKVLGVKE